MRAWGLSAFSKSGTIWNLHSTRRATTGAVSEGGGVGWRMVQVQSGVARTGKWWGHQHFDGADPDIMLFAKARPPAPLPPVFPQGK